MAAESSCTTQTCKLTARAWACLALTLCLGLAPVAYSLSLIREYPRSDEGAYLERAHEAYLAYRDSGLLSSFSTMYKTRGLQPTFHPVIALPFLIFSQGHVLFSHASASLFSYLVLLTYLYLLGLLYLPPARAMLFTLLVGSAPSIMGSAVAFHAEVPLLASSVAVIYHAARSKSFSLHRHVMLAGLWLGLAVCIRPIEASFIFGLPAIAAWVSSRRGLALYPMSSITKAMLLAFSLVAGWYLPYTAELYDWIYSCSFGERVRLFPAAGGVNNRGLFAYFAHAFDVTTGPSLLATAAIGTVVISSRAKTWSTFVARAGSAPLKLFALTVLGPILFLTISALSPSNDFRYQIAGANLLLIPLLLTALMPAEPFGQARAILIALLAVPHFAICLAIAANGPESLQSSPFQLYKSDFYVIRDKRPKLDRATPVVESLLALLPPQTQGYAAFLTETPLERDTYSNAVLNMMSRAKGSGYYFIAAPKDETSEMDEQIAELQSSADYVVILRTPTPIPIDEGGSVWPNHLPPLINALRVNYTSKSLAQMGFKPVAADKRILVFKTKRGEN